MPTGTNTLHVGDTVTIAGANQQQYNGSYTVTAVAGDTFSYVPNGTPSLSPATGTITYVPRGFKEALKYVVGPQAYARLAAALPSGTTPLTATDAQMAPYADEYYEYDTQGRIVKETKAGTGSSGQGTYSYSYGTNASVSVVTTNPTTYALTYNPNYNAWTSKVVTTLPDGTIQYDYFNRDGQNMLSVTKDVTTGKMYGTFTEYDSLDRAILVASPSAVVLPANLATLEQYSDLLHNLGPYTTRPQYQYLSSTSGLVTITDYYSSGDTPVATNSTAGAVPNYVKDTSVRAGQFGADIPQEFLDYFEFQSGNATSVQTADDTIYGQTGKQDARTTRYNYSIYSGTVQPQSITTINPPITGAQNGPATSTSDTSDADTTIQYFDAWGRIVWTKDPDGFITYDQYDPSTGGLVKHIDDVNTSDTGDFSGSSVSLPTGWSTPSGGGLELITQYVVDALGRTIRQTDPNNNMTFTVYNDTAHEQRVYPGMGLAGQATSTGLTTVLVDTNLTGTSTSSYVGDELVITGGTDSGQVRAVTAYDPPSHSLTVSPGFTSAPDSTTVFILVAPTPAGPIQVTREYRPVANAPSGQQTVYDESLTSSATPHLTLGVPDGTETIDQTNIQSLRRQLTDNGGQVVEEDDYFSLSGLTYSQAAAQLGSSSNNSASGNYHATIYGFDAAGRQNRILEPTGTIRRTVYDGLGRVVSRWTGTNDTPASGNWSPTNNTSPSNMIDAEDDGYDQTHDFLAAPASAPTLSSSAEGGLPATTYSVRVTYVGAGGETIASSESTSSVSANHLLTVTSPSSVTGATGYNVYAAACLPAPGFPGTVFTGASTTGGHLVGGTTYYYVVTATNAYGETTVSAEQSYTVPSGTSTNQITLNWNSVFGATGYKVYRGTSSGSEQLLAVVSGGSTTSYADNTSTTPSGAKPTTNTTASGAEVLQNPVPIALGTGWTEPVAGIEPGTLLPPPAPALSSGSGSLSANAYYVVITYVGPGTESPPSVENNVSVSASGSIIVTTPPSAAGATGYNVYVGTSSGNEVLQNTTGPIAIGTNYTVSSLASGLTQPAAPTLTYATIGGSASNDVTYYVRITYTGSSLESLPSAEANVDVPANGLLQVTPSGTAPTGATGYNVYVSMSSGEEVLQNSTPIGLTSTWQESASGLAGIGASLPVDVGDSNLTQVTQHPGGGTSDRVTLNLYDYRDRLIATKQGALMSSGIPNTSGETDGAHRLITYYNLDNQGEALGTYTYAGDQVSLNDFINWSDTGSDPGSLRAWSRYAYDDRGRTYQSTLVSIDPTNGVSSLTDAQIQALPGLVTNVFYNHRGFLMAEIDPGGQVTKHAYDGAGRDIKDSTTDGGVLSGAPQDWSHAGSTSSDVVLEQTLTTYDGAGNSIKTIDRQRFDTDPTSATGDLAGPSGSTLASRDYYSAAYYDAANRVTDQVNVGTNGGSAWTRPATVPSGSATVLVTHTDYNSAGLVGDTIGPRSGTTATSYGIYDETGYTYDLLGRKTQEIDAWDGTTGLTASGNSKNQITQYTYDGNSDTLTMTAVMQPSGTPAVPNQTTAYVYGVGGTIGTNLFSNDLVAKVEYPDKSTGNASTSAANDQSFSYDFLGEKTGFTDQNGTTHAYLFDVLGRLTADKVTGFGTGVDQAVKRLGYSFDSAGRSYQQTSYSDAAGTTVVNQVTDTYNGLGQLISEVQNHGTGFHSGTVQYNYTQMNSGQNNSRLVSTVDPNGRVVDYTYGGENTITSLTSSSTTATATTAGPHGLVVGSKVTVQGASPVAYDGTFTVTAVLSPTQFQYTFAGGTSPATGTDITASSSPQVPISTITHTGTTANAASAVSLGLTTGTVFQVTVTGASPSLYDGTFTATVTGSTTFSYTMSGTPSGSATGTDMVAVNTPQQFAISSITYNSTTLVATATTSASMGLATGTTFTMLISGASPAQYDGAFIVTVTGSTTFTYKLTSDPGSSASGSNMIAGLNLTLDGALSRLSGMVDHAGSTPNTMLEGYTYLGAGTIVQKNRPQPGVDLTYIQQNGDTLHGTDAGDRYTGLDRFGRVVDQYWVNPNTPSSPTDRFQYGYDQDSNVLYRNNLVNTSFAELYHANSSGSGDNVAAYDSLDRIQNFRRGVLSASANNGGVLDTVTTLNGLSGSSNSWTLNTVGDWTSQGANNYSYNAQNEVTGNGSLGYDNNGNTTTESNLFAYDAWNRLVKYYSNTTTLETMQYDADNRRIISVGCGGSPSTESYYDANWQVVEDDITTTGCCGSTTTHSTYAWGPSYVDDLVERDSDSGTSRVYAQQDANHDVTAITQTNGSVLERFIYDPYGTFTVLSAAWGSGTDSQSWIYRYQGGRYDTNDGLYNFRNRDYSAFYGRWMQRDPAGYVDGANVYQFERSGPEMSVDPSGLQRWTFAKQTQKSVHDSWNLYPTHTGHHIIWPANDRSDETGYYGIYPTDEGGAASIENSYWEDEGTIFIGGGLTNHKVGAKWDRTYKIDQATGNIWLDHGKGPVSAPSFQSGIAFAHMKVTITGEGTHRVHINVEAKTGANADVEIKTTGEGSGSFEKGGFTGTLTLGTEMTWKGQVAETKGGELDWDVVSECH